MYRPEGQGRPIDTPATQYSPARQSKHADRPLSFMNFPGAHERHSASPVTLPNVPGRQPVQVLLLVCCSRGLNLPMGQRVQSLLALAP